MRSLSVSFEDVSFQRKSHILLKHIELKEKLLDFDLGLC